METLTSICVTTIIIVIVLGLSIGTVQSGNYDPRPWHIAQWCWGYHGYDVAVCVDDMTFTRGAGPNAGQVCRIILPEELRGDTLCL
jgi:hypothetical protein